MKFYRKIYSLIILVVYLITTSGVSVFQHFCHQNHHKIVQVFTAPSCEHDHKAETCELPTTDKMQQNCCTQKIEKREGPFLMSEACCSTGVMKLSIEEQYKHNEISEILPKISIYKSQFSCEFINFKHFLFLTKDIQKRGPPIFHARTYVYFLSKPKIPVSDIA